MIKHRHIRILEKYYNSDIIDIIKSCWDEPHRFYHNVDHLNSMLDNIDNYFIEKTNLYDSDLYDSFVLAAFFHDIVYDVKSKNNEEMSIDLFIDFSIKRIPRHMISFVIKLIETTKKRKPPVNENERLFWEFDNDILINSSLNQLVEYEEKISKEFGFLDKKTYTQKRIEFLENEKYLNRHIEDLILFIKKKDE